MPTGSVSCRMVASPRVSLRGWSLTRVTLRQLLCPSHSWTVVSAVAAMVTCSCCDWNSIQASRSPGAGHQAVSLRPSKAEVSDFDASGEAVGRHRRAGACGGVVLHPVAHRAVLPLGGEVAGLAVDGAVVAHRKRRGVGDHIGIPAGQSRREVAELAPQQRQHLAAAVHRNRLAVRLHHVRVRVQQEDVHLAEARIRLAQTRRRRLALKVAAHHHRAHTNGTQRLPIDELRLPLQPPNRLRIHQGHRVAERETRLGQRLDRLVTRPPPRLPRK